MQNAKRKYVQAKAAYYNKQPVMTDAEFDMLENRIREHDPGWPELFKTGAVDPKKKPVALKPYYMPSLDKLYPEDTDKWFDNQYRKRKGESKCEWAVMAKLDGTSLQVVYEVLPGTSFTQTPVKLYPVALYTRGDGETGGDVTFFLPWLIAEEKIPAVITSDEHVSVRVFRLEAVMRKDVFQRGYAKAAGGEWDNARNGVNGVFNRKTRSTALADISLVVLSVFGMSLVDGFRFASQNGFEVVPAKITFDATRNDVATWLVDHLDAMTTRSPFAIDGLVIANPFQIVMPLSADRPKGMIAFKVNSADAEVATEVKEVIWEKTRQLRWQPKIRIEPVEMDGATVTYVTAHNPVWMMEHGIGRGAIVRVLRSGGVIPKIVGVDSKAPFNPPPGPYKQDGRFFLMLEGDNETAIRAIHHFMVSLGIETLAEKRLTLMQRKFPAIFGDARGYIYNKGKMRTYFVQAGLGEVESAKMANEIFRVLSQPLPLVDLMVASGCFTGGVGKRRLTALFESKRFDFRRYLNSVVKNQYMSHDLAAHGEAGIIGESGFGEVVARSIVESVSAFVAWYLPIQDYVTIQKQRPKDVRAGNCLIGVKVAFTSYRDKEQEDYITDMGGIIVNYGASMDVLLWRKGAKFMDKIRKAGAKAMLWEDFIRKYNPSEGVPE